MLLLSRRICSHAEHLRQASSPSDSAAGDGILGDDAPGSGAAYSYGLVVLRWRGLGDGVLADRTSGIRAADTPGAGR